MANGKTEISIKADHNNLLLIILIALVAFSAGFVIARARYKSQLRTTYEMVMEREDKISNMQDRMMELEVEMKAKEANPTPAKRL